MSGIPTPPIGAPVVPARGALRPLGLESVRITGGFWGERQAVNGTATFPHILEWLEADGSFTNFDAAAAGTVVEERRGREFSDSDMYKVLEGMAWEIGRTDDADLEKKFRELVARFARVPPGERPLDCESTRERFSNGWTRDSDVSAESPLPACC